MRAGRRHTIMSPLRAAAGLIPALIAGVFATTAGTEIARAADRGVIAGVVRHGATNDPVPGVTIKLSRGSRQDDRVQTQITKTDGRGRFRFDDLQTGQRHVYALDAEYDDGVFAGGALTLPDRTGPAPVIETTLRVWETTSDPSAIVVRRDDLFLLPGEGSTASVIQTITAVNQSERAYIGRAARAGRRASFGFALPAGASGGVSVLRADLDIPEIVETSFGFAATVAVPPGEHKITVGYRIEGAGGSFDLSRPALYPLLEATVFAPPEYRVAANRFEETSEEMVDGTRYVRYSTTEAVEAGDALQVVATADASGSAPLAIGGAAALAAVLLLGGTAFLRGRGRASRGPRNSGPATGSIAREGGDRHETLVEIARLDDSFRAGDIDEQTWRTRRAELKDRLDPPAGRG